jgi:Right handed beta helix region
MADRSWRFTLAAFTLPLFLLAMVGFARANTIVVNTLDSGTSDTFPLCTLEEAVIAANTQAPSGGCPAGTGEDTILFSVTGTIFPDDTMGLANSEEDLSIIGPAYGGITINGLFNIGLFEVEDAELNLVNLTLTGGVGEGGGGVLSFDSTVSIENCTFADNEAGIGGAIFAEESGVFLLNNTFTQNGADEGGAIANDGSEFLISNNTFSGNGADDGADIASEGESVVNNSIFANSSSGGNCDGVIDEGYNISDDDSCGFTSPSVNNSTTLNLDPLGLENNGGPTETIALIPPSQAIDFIPIASCLDLFGGAVTTDQRGFARPDSDNLNACDAGAYEFDAAANFALVPNSERVQIALSTTNANSDDVNIALTFIENLAGPTCQPDQDALNAGFDVMLYEGHCTDALVTGLQLTLSPFVVQTVRHASYGTLYQNLSPETVSARLVALPTQPLPACGEWTLNLEVTGLNTKALDLGGTNPFALVLTTADGALAGCFDVTNAIVGNQIDPPKRSPRRGVRRGVRR